MCTAEFHYLLGRYVAEREKVLGVEGHSLLAACHRCGVPVYTSSPGRLLHRHERGRAWRSTAPSSRIDVNARRQRDRGHRLRREALRGQERGLDPRRRQPEELHAPDRAADPGGLGLAEKGHDYFLQITDARPDTGGLSGATPAEAVSWGKIDPDQLPDAVVCYTDTTIALPLLTAYALANREARPLKRLYDRREQMLERLRQDYLARVGSPR